MHANNLAHRDLKSANIMMSVRGEVKISMCTKLQKGRICQLTNLCSRSWTMCWSFCWISHSYGWLSFLDAARLISLSSTSLLPFPSCDIPSLTIISFRPFAHDVLTIVLLEMIQCKPHNSAVDIWSFAISLLEIANQRYFFLNFFCFFECCRLVVVVLASCCRFVVVLSTSFPFPFLASPLLFIYLFPPGHQWWKARWRQCLQ